jgi:hypothetical protein
MRLGARGKEAVRPLGGEHSRAIERAKSGAAGARWARETNA